MNESVENGVCDIRVHGFDGDYGRCGWVAGAEGLIGGLDDRIIF